MEGRRRYKRNASMNAWSLMWSAAKRQPVKCLLRAGGHRIGVVDRTYLDPSRASHPKVKTDRKSTVVGVFENGVELAVDDIERVLMPREGSGSVFVDPYG